MELELFSTREILVLHVWNERTIYSIACIGIGIFVEYCSEKNNIYILKFVFYLQFLGKTAY